MLAAVGMGEKHRTMGLAPAPSLSHCPCPANTSLFQACCRLESPKFTIPNAPIWAPFTPLAPSMSHLCPKLTPAPLVPGAPCPVGSICSPHAGPSYCSCCLSAQPPILGHLYLSYLTKFLSINSPSSFPGSLLPLPAPLFSFFPSLAPPSSLSFSAPSTFSLALFNFRCPKPCSPAQLQVAWQPPTTTTIAVLFSVSSIFWEVDVRS